MKILLYSPLPPPAGGIATWTEYFLSFCNGSDHEVQVVNTAFVGARATKTTSNIPVFSEISRTFGILRTTFQKMWRFSPDVVYINSSCARTGLIRDGIAVFLARKKPIIFHCHCDVVRQIGNSGLSRRIMGYIAKKASMVLVLNSRSRDFMETIESAKVHVVPNFISQDYLADTHRVSPQIRNVVFVGHVRNAKGVPEILQAAQMLPEIHFRLIGPVSDEILALPKPENVCFAGPMDPANVRQELLDSDLFLFPTHSEGFSIALLEAMAVGLPVITTDVGANRDMIESEGGMIVPVEDAQAIRDAIKTISAPERRQQASEWNLLKVRNTYLQNCVLSDIFSMIRSVCR